MNHDEVLSTHTLKFRYSFFLDTLNSWNSVSSFISSVPTLNIFKMRDIVFFNITLHPIYGIHDPIGLKYLTRLHVGLSNLHAHKFYHNFKDTSLMHMSK